MVQISRIRWAQRSFIAVAVGAALLTTACGPGGGAPADAGDAQGEFPAEGTVAYFGPTDENPYFRLNFEGARDTAEEYGWEVEQIQSSTQEEQDAAVRQMLSQGDKPLGVIMNPIMGEAAVATEQAIMEADLPLILINQVPAENQEALFTAYAGVNDTLSGETAAQLLIDGAEKAGIELGDGIIVNTLAGHTATRDRAAGFEKVLSEEAPSASVLADQPSGGFLEAEGYDLGSQLIPANQGKINWVYGVNDALAVGAMRAAKENGIEVGEEMLFVGGTCMNAATNQAVLDGDLVGTAVQAPWIEGASGLYALAAYLKTGEVQDGSINLEADTPPSIDTPPSKYNFMPNPPVENTQESFDSTMVWGKPASELCDY